MLTFKAAGELSSLGIFIPAYLRNTDGNDEDRRWAAVSALHVPVPKLWWDDQILELPKASCLFPIIYLRLTVFLLLRLLIVNVAHLCCYSRTLQYSEMHEEKKYLYMTFKQEVEAHKFN